MKALDFIQIFASNVRRMDFRLSSAQVILAIIGRVPASQHHHGSDAAAPQHRYKHFAGPHRAGLRGALRDCRPYVYRSTERGRQLAGNLLDKQTQPDS